MSSAAKLVTGVRGLDDVLHGGLYAGRVYLIEGSPGAGKTTLAMQFLRAGVAAGQRCVYFALSESTDELTTAARSHGWALDGIDIVEVIGDGLDPDHDQSVLHPSELELGETIRSVMREVAERRPERIVFDSLSEMRLLVQSAFRYRRQVMALKRFFTSLGCTVLLLDDATRSAELQLHSVVHGVLALEQEATDFGGERRRLRVTKMRASTYLEGWQDYRIETGGLVVFPRLIVPPPTEALLRDVIGSGAAGLDALLGGGLVRGTNTLLMGPSGVGKTSTVMAAAVSAAEHGEKVVLFLSDESMGSLLTRSANLGLDLRPHRHSGRLSIVQIDPVQVSSGQFAAMVAASVVEDGATVVVIDSLTAYMQALPNERVFLLQMHELLAFLNAHNTVTLLVFGQLGSVADVRATVDLGYLADAVVLLRFFEADGAVRKAISVLKTRTLAHESTIRELKLGPSGLSIGAPLTGFRGVLSGMPEFVGPSSDIMGLPD